MLILIFFITLLGSALTFFSGFGLGTILLPVFLVIFPLEIAIPATAFVHFSNSVVKFVVVYKNIHFPILLKFGIPAVIAAFIGSELLFYFSAFKNLYTYSFFGEKEITVSGVNFIVGLLIIGFTLLEANKKFKNLAFSSKHLILGGFLSGFFGGISGHQGALRSLFLKKTNLSKEQLVATSNSISLGIDILRIIVYINLFSFLEIFSSSTKWYIIAGILGAIIGVNIGNQLLKKITIGILQKIISICLVFFGLLMILGIV